MTTPELYDQRLTAAIHAITSGNIKLLSLDVFDTLLIRRVPRPPDVFLLLGMKLLEKNLLCHGQTPESFAAIRYQTEYAARDLQQRANGNREVTLEEIYSNFPQHIVRIPTSKLVSAEIELERKLCFANPDIPHVALFAKKHGLKLALISNTYMNKQTLQSLITSKAPNLPAFDELLVSNAYRCGKRDGLMQLMLEKFSIKPNQCLHIGDDPISDRDTANKLGVPCIYIGHNEEDFSLRLAQEHPIQWHERATYFGDDNGDYGITWLRRQAGFWPTHNMKAPEEELYRYGSRMLGPLLTGFAAWIQARLKAEKAKALYGITREGELLTNLVSKFPSKTKNKLLATSRLTAALASFSPDHPNHLEDFLTRRGHWSLAALMDQLGFNAEQTKTIGNPEATLETFSPKELTKTILTSPLAGILFDRSHKQRQRLLQHLKQIGALENKHLYLADLGYAATIQRAIQRIFTIEKIPIITHGLYMVSAHVSLATQMAGGIVEGFLAQNGNPNDFARAFCRSPEVAELSCMPSYGTVIGYKEDGAPEYASDSISTRQQQEVDVVQRGIYDFANHFLDLMAREIVTPAFTSKNWQNQIRAIATRLVVYPSAKEAELVGHWQADSDLGLASPRPIISTGAYSEKTTAMMTAEELASLPRRDIPWLYGIAANIDSTLARQVANLMLRK